MMAESTSSHTTTRSRRVIVASARSLLSFVIAPITETIFFGRRDIERLRNSAVRADARMSATDRVRHSIHRLFLSIRTQLAMRISYCRISANMEGLRKAVRRGAQDAGGDDSQIAEVNPSQRYLKFAPAGRLSDDLVVWTRTQEGDRWRHLQSCLAACWSLYTTVLTEW